MSEIPQNKWSSSEKANLRNRILDSAKREKQLRVKRKKQRVYWMAAAMVPIFIVLGFFYITATQEPSIDQFVKGLPESTSQDSEQVTVVLGKGNQVVVEGDEGRVEYSETGSSVKVGGGKSIEQQAVKNNRPTFNTIMVPFGKRSFIKLSDGTKVWINSGSRLVFPVVFSKKTREVYLEGEAIFEVAHNANKPFRVKSSTQDIEVLGTVFNVSHYPDDQVMNTVLKSGSIKISYLDQKDKGFVMKPGTLSSFNRSENQVTVKQVDPNEYFSWRDGFISLNNNSLQDIVNRISRYYNVPIQVQGKNLEDLTFSGRLDLSDDIDKVLTTILESSDLTMVREAETIILTQ
ncbi:FecR family protein [Flagellimonas aurea]|uniref:FecR family protein n=1 Tax=Flagellimonas aurea TaxID=2915619 RepID=UPI0035CFB4D8